MTGCEGDKNIFIAYVCQLLSRNVREEFGSPVQSLSQVICVVLNVL